MHISAQTPATQLFATRIIVSVHTKRLKFRAIGLQIIECIHKCYDKCHKKAPKNYTNLSAEHAQTG